MRKLTAIFCLMMAMSPLVQAQEKKEPSAKQKAQQDRMTSCNKQAGDKKMEGEARKSFMSSCLKGETPDKKEPSAKQKAQQDRMTSCNKQAGDKKMEGEARKKFMSSCLKG